MGIDFDKTRWQKVLANWDAWFDGTLGRPMICPILVDGNDPGRPAPASKGKTGFVPIDLDTPIDAILDAHDYQLSCCRFLGDAFPSLWPNYGAGVLAAFLGATVDARRDGGTVWFHPPRDQEPDQLHLALDRGNFWFQHVRSFMQAAIDRWDGLVQIGMTDLGGALDVLSTFRSSQKLLLDLYDCPDEVERLVWEIFDAWIAAWDAFNEVLQPVNPGYQAWAGLVSSHPHYMLQSDFCYMISPEMFDRFVRPELAAVCKRIPCCFYHLDGVGELPHLDSLLTIEELKGVQWIPGAGKPDNRNWPDVYRKIHGAGKLMQTYVCSDDGVPDFYSLDKVADQIGAAEPMCAIFRVERKYEDDVLKMLERFGCPTE